jgi:hypothetical protein
MNLNLGYVALYGMSRSVAKVCMIFICIFSVIIYVSFMLDLFLMLFIAHLMNFSVAPVHPRALPCGVEPLVEWN